VGEHLDKYFLKDVKDNIENFTCIRNPINIEIADSMLTGNEQEELAKISCDKSLKMCFMQQRLQILVQFSLRISFVISKGS